MLDATNSVFLFSMIGFCWGAWVNFHASATDKITCAVSAHPSVQIEQAFGGNEVDLAKKVKCPQVLMPAGGDPDNLKPGSSVGLIIFIFWILRRSVSIYHNVLHSCNPVLSVTYHRDRCSRGYHCCHHCQRHLRKLSALPTLTPLSPPPPLSTPRSPFPIDTVVTQWW